MLLCLKLSNGSLLFDQGFSALRSHLDTNSLACVAYTRESTVADRQEVELRVANIQTLLKSQDGIRDGRPSMTAPETRYARSGDIRIAYQVAGGGELDLVFVPGFISNLDVAWEEPGMARFFSRLAAFSRLIMFDKRGTGLSDRVSGIASLENRMDDVRAVMDAVESERAALFGFSEGGAMSMLFAATYPHLIVYGTRPVPRPENWVRDRLVLIDRSWGTGEIFGQSARSKVADEACRRSFARWERAGASPAAVIQLTRMNAEIDIRQILPTIHTPALILHRIGDVIEDGRYVADHIPGAKFVELPGGPIISRSMITISATAWPMRSRSF
jgi:pimeloyl-ACP methyl ester carboxylesterase